MMRILIIEDERDVSNVLVEILEQAGFETVTAPAAIASSGEISG